MHGIKVVPTSREERFERTSVPWGLRMQREVDPLNLDLVVSPKPVNTPGTEIAPGSDKISENL